MKRRAKLYWLPYTNTVFLSQITMLHVTYCTQELHVHWQCSISNHPAWAAIHSCLESALVYVYTVADMK
jgi:hypothetical protein